MDKNDLLTRQDLALFKAELIDEIKAIINSTSTPSSDKWLKSRDVKKILGISEGTLESLRNSGELPGRKIGGIYFYSHKMLLKKLTK